MIFESWSDLFRVLIVGACAYVGLVLLLRVAGKRTLSKMNAFDLVVTVAIGSTLAAVLLNRDVSLAEGLTAFALLCILQFLVTSLSVRSQRFQSFVKADPALLFFRGNWRRAAMRRERVTEEEILASMRSAGKGDLAQVSAVVLETDGTLSVLTGQAEVGEGTISNIKS